MKPVFYVVSYIILGGIFGLVEGDVIKILPTKTFYRTYSVEDQSDWNKLLGRNVICTTTKITIYQDGKILTNFGLNEAFNWNDNGVFQTVGVDRQSSSGLTLFRYWVTKFDRSVSELEITGWIILSNTGELVIEDLKKIRFESYLDETNTIRIGRHEIILKKTHSIRHQI